MQPEMVDQCLANYREYSARCYFLEHEIHEMKSLVERLRSTALEDAVTITQVITDMPHGTNISDPTGRLASNFADGYIPDYIKEIEDEIKKRENEYRYKLPTIVFVDAWLKALNKRERFVIENKTIGGMFWRDLITAYKNEFGEEYSRQGLKKIRDRAILMIYKVAE